MYVLKQLKEDMEFNTELSNIIKVFKTVAISEFHRLQLKKDKYSGLISILERVKRNIDWRKCIEYPLLKEEKDKNSVLILITSKEGFCGDLNSRIIDKAFSQRENQKDEFIVFGEKGARLLEDIGQEFIQLEVEEKLEIEYSWVKKIVEYLINNFLNGRWKKVILIYPKFVSFVYQKITSVRLLPFSPLSEKEILTRQELLFEPSLERIIEFVIKVDMVVRLYDAFWESRFSEWSARIFHLENSTQNLSQWFKEIRHLYFKTLHEMRDRNIREIFASRLQEEF